MPGAIDNADVGQYWYMYGRTKIGLWKPGTATLTIHYEMVPETWPNEWEQVLADYVTWRAMERMGGDALRDAVFYRQQFYAGLKQLGAKRDKQIYTPKIPRTLDY